MNQTTHSSGKWSLPLEKLPESGLTLELQPSIVLFLIYFVLIIAVFYAIALLPLHLGLKALFSIIVISYVLWFLSEKIFFTHPRAVNKLVMTELSLCFIQRRDGSTMKANLDSNPVILDNLVILRFRSEAAEHGINKWLGSKSIIITAKMAGPKNFKALKRHLRLAVKRSDP